MMLNNIDLNTIHLLHLTGNEETGFVNHIAKRFGFTLKLNIRGDKKCFVLVREPKITKIKNGMN